MHMQSNDTEEILCANCGRPNLPEATKCWYCQSLLNENTGNAAQDSEGGDNQPPELIERQPAAKPAPPQEMVEDIPDWLKRIREKEQKDREALEARDQWRQQALFGNSAPSELSEPVLPARKKEIRRKEPEGALKPVGQEIQAAQPLPDPTPPPTPPPAQPQAAEAEIAETEDAADDPEGESSDLPDGFIRFDPKSR
jgi:hypothetical protein